MPHTTPTPRAGNFMGMRTTAHINPDSTWLEPEELCYPKGGMTRRAYVRCPDGKLRVVVCGIPDTYFSIPARLRIGRTNKDCEGTISVIKGYVTGCEAPDGTPSLEFRPFTGGQND